MEQKKLLWVIFSAVGFVLIIAAAGLIFFWPRDARSAEEGDQLITGLTREFDPVEWVRKDQDYPGIEEEAEDGDNVILVYGDSEEETAASETSAGEKAAEDGADTDGTLQTSTSKDGVVIEIYQPQPAKQAVKETGPSVTKTEPERRTERLKEYWIQAGSYTSMVRANEVKGDLSEKGIASVITTKTVNNTDYYRVRIGPYGSKAEAEKFLGWIQGVQGFETSYVSMVYVTRRLN